MTLRLASGFGFGGFFQRTLPCSETADFSPSYSSRNETIDEKWMGIALEHSMQNIGLPNPNPGVGCIIVKDGKEIARGTTERYRARHGERVAFDSLPDKSVLKDSTVYVTLEPCSHTGFQPPCVSLLMENPIKRVVIARLDPDPRVSGAGAEQLRRCGKEVVVGTRHAEATAWNYNFLGQQLLKRPIVAAKWAQTLDGHLADDLAGSKWISGPTSRAYTHWLRQKYDGIMVGAGTVLNDFPSLNIRDCALPHNQAPVKIVFDPQGRTLECDSKVQSRLLETTFRPAEKLIVFTHEKNIEKSSDWISKLRENENILFLTFKNAEPLLQTLLERLSEEATRSFLGRPFQSLMVEGGPSLISRLFEADLIDVAHVFIAPLLLGGSANRIAAPQTGSVRGNEPNTWSTLYSPYPFLLSGAKRFQTLSTVRFENDLMMEFVPSDRYSKIFEQ